MVDVEVAVVVAARSSRCFAFLLQDDDAVVSCCKGVVRRTKS